MNNLDPHMKELFHMVGIDKEEQVDKDTIDFMYDFVEKREERRHQGLAQGDQQPEAPATHPAL